MPLFRYLLAATALIATPVYAQDTTALPPGVSTDTAGDTAPPSAITVSGSATIVSDYRFRGVSQSDKDLAVQAGITVTHESGLYVGAWGSNLAGWGTFGG